LKIALFTNDYLPKVGGVAHSVERFSRGLLDRGHEVLIVCPEFAEARRDPPHVLRVPAIRNFNGSDFSMPLPPGPAVTTRMNDFSPDLVHAHHPFLLGDAAVRAAAHRGLPLIYTHHTLYEHYTHYVPMELEAMKHYIVRLGTRYANLCDRVIAPSESIRELLRSRGVRTEIDVLPTGVDTAEYARGDRGAVREEFGIAAETDLLGHVGRLAPEKNLEFLGSAVAEVLADRPGTEFLLVGYGPGESTLREIFRKRGLERRVHFAGKRTGSDLVNAYHAMDLFVFASKTETQGMVLVEAMAAGCPVAALEASGVREVVRDGRNGRLVAEESVRGFAEAVRESLDADENTRRSRIREARAVADEFDTRRCLRRLEQSYRDLLARRPGAKDPAVEELQTLLRSIRTEWELWAGRLASASEAVLPSSREKRGTGSS
jgi:glycosyltransferase involved in cell wall biosynthesis